MRLGRGYSPQDGRGFPKWAWLTNLPLQALHGGCLSHVAHMHCDLGAPAEGFGVKEQDDGGFELAADGRVHLRADQHHPL